MRNSMSHKAFEKKLANEYFGKIIFNFLFKNHKKEGMSFGFLQKKDVFS